MCDIIINGCPWLAKWKRSDGVGDKMLEACGALSTVGMLPGAECIGGSSGARRRDRGHVGN